MAHQSALHITVLCKRWHYISVWIWNSFQILNRNLKNFTANSFQVIHAVFWSWWLLGCSFDSFTFSGPCKYTSNVNLFDKAVFTPFTCDSEIPCSFWVCVFNHSEAKETWIFPCVEQTEKQAAQCQWRLSMWRCGNEDTVSRHGGVVSVVGLGHCMSLFHPL